MPQSNKNLATVQNNSSSAISSVMKGGGPFMLNESSADDQSKSQDPTDYAQETAHSNTTLSKLSRGDSATIENKISKEKSNNFLRPGSSTLFTQDDAHSQEDQFPKENENQNSFDRYYKQDREEDGQLEEEGHNNESLDAVNISTPGTN